MFLKQEKPELDDLKEEKKNCVSKGQSSSIGAKFYLFTFREAAKKVLLLMARPLRPNPPPPPPSKEKNLFLRLPLGNLQML